MGDPNAPPQCGNPFVPVDLESMTPAHRRAYASRLGAVRDTLMNIHRASSDGEAIGEVVEEIKAALRVLQARDDPRGHDAA